MQHLSIRIDRKDKSGTVIGRISDDEYRVRWDDGIVSVVKMSSLKKAVTQEGKRNG